MSTQMEWVECTTGWDVTIPSGQPGVKDTSDNLCYFLVTERFDPVRFQRTGRTWVLRPPPTGRPVTLLNPKNVAAGSDKCPGGYYDGKKDVKIELFVELAQGDFK